MKNRFFILLAILTVGILVVGCGEKSAEDSAEQSVRDKAENRSPYLPKNDVEFNNYVNAQKLYDDPTTIIWCTAFPSSPAAPFVTVPVAGKLTSSSTTFFNPETLHDAGTLPSRSVDGLYHPNPPQYRFGFTPGGQYVDFFNLETLCTTQPLKFQRENLAVTPDSALANADAKAQEALKNGDSNTAQKILEAAAGGQ